MNDDTQRTDVAAAQIDRLVSGDLSESDHRSLLAWLDEEPARWRTCGLAFLEAQVWERATACPEIAVGNALRGAPAREGEAPAEPPRRGSGFGVHDGDRIAKSPWTHWLAIAGLLLVAFGAGALSAWTWIPGRGPIPQFAQPELTPHTSPAGPLLATVSVRTNLDPRLSAQLTLPVEPMDAPLADAASSIPEYVRKQWDRRGYEVVEETRYLPAKMPDGRSVMVPVNKVRLKFKGIPVS